MTAWLLVVLGLHLVVAQGEDDHRNDGIGFGPRVIASGSIATSNCGDVRHFLTMVQEAQDTDTGDNEERLNAITALIDTFTTTTTEFCEEDDEPLNICKDRTYLAEKLVFESRSLAQTGGLLYSKITETYTANGAVADFDLVVADTCGGSVPSNAHYVFECNAAPGIFTKMSVDRSTPAGTTNHAALQSSVYSVMECCLSPLQVGDCLPAFCLWRPDAIPGLCV